MAFLFFLPLCIASIVSGASAALLRWSKSQMLPDLERRVGAIVAGLVVIEVLALAAALAVG